MRRRDFLKNISLATTAAPLMLNGVPLSIMAEDGQIQRFAAASENDRVLVVLQMHGGNDGLNTVIPIDQYSLYYNRRPNVAIPDFGSRKYITLDGTLDDNKQVGLHPDMVGMKQLYDEGKLGIVQGVSYENNNQSHFRGRDIWFMGGDYNEYLGSGWVGRYLDQVFPNYPEAYPNADMPDPLALEIGNEVSLIFHRDNGIPVSISIRNPEQFFNLVEELQGFQDKQNIDPRGIPPTAIENTYYGQQLKWILQLEEKSDTYAERLNFVYGQGSNSSVTYPELYPLNAPAGYLRNGLAGQLKLVARLLSGGSKTKVFLVRIGGFDSHAEQVEDYDPSLGRHSALLYHVSAAMKAFQDDLKNLGLEDRVLTITTSEFGRRIDSNASYGTDHGTSAPLFVFGKYAQPGVVGDNPDLTTTSSNLPMQYDYRQVFTSILQDWFGASDTQVVNTMFGDYLNQKLPIIATGTPTSINDFINARFRLNNCFPNPANASTTFSFYINSELYVALNLFDIQGRLVKKIVNERKAMGLHEIPVDLQDLKAGTYLYKIEAGALKTSKKLIIKR